MSGAEIRNLFRLLASNGQPAAGVAFSALPTAAAGGHMAALSAGGRPGLLLLTAPGGRRPADIRLAGLNARFGITCSISVGRAPPEEHRISIIECTADADTVPLFAESVGSFLHLLGAAPTMAEAAAAVARFAAIFSSLTCASKQSVTGLIGELMLLMMATDPAAAVGCWRVAPTDRFDFAAADARVECKAASGGLRLHSFSWEQCSPPDGAALVSSFRVESAGGGTSIRSLLDRIEARLASAPDAAVRLRETVAATMGRSLPQALDTTFDEALCRTSLQWFDLRQVPALRGELPSGVAAVRFMSDVSQAGLVSAGLLAGTGLAALIPHG